MSMVRKVFRSTKGATLCDLCFMMGLLAVVAIGLVAAITMLAPNPGGIGTLVQNTPVVPDAPSMVNGTFFFED